MTNDSGLFRTRAELEEKEGAWPVGGNRYDSRSGAWVPLYVGRMIQAIRSPCCFGIKVNQENLHQHSAEPSRCQCQQNRRSEIFCRTPQYWVPADKLSFPAAVG